jgi:hypothetical protein
MEISALSATDAASSRLEMTHIWFQKKHQEPTNIVYYRA